MVLCRIKWDDRAYDIEVEYAFSLHSPLIGDIFLNHKPTLNSVCFTGILMDSEIALTIIESII